MSKKGSNLYVSRELCDERTKRLEQKIDGMKNEILLAIKNKGNNGMSWKAKASIIGSVLLSFSSIVVAYIQTLS